jgi:hypothetical protein
MEIRKVPLDSEEDIRYEIKNLEEEYDDVVAEWITDNTCAVSYNGQCDILYIKEIQNE